MKSILTFCLFFTICTLTFSQSDEFSTSIGPVTLHPVLHGSLVLETEGTTIYIDPYGGADLFSHYSDPDLILITHAHGDHLNPETLSGLEVTHAEIIAPQSVVEKLNESDFKKVHSLANDESVDFRKINILAFPMYNLPGGEPIRHEKGWGNGYILTFGDTKVYISGDTEDIPEMRALQDIDVSLVCMNLPYTMDVESAASAVIDFAPKVVYPYHFRGGGGTFSDIAKFKERVDAANKGVEVRLRKWYPEE